MSLVIRTEHLRRGQPRAYAPHIYESRITCEWEKERERLENQQVKELAKVLVHWFTEEPVTDMGSHFQPRLRSLELIAEERCVAGRWTATGGDAQEATPGRDTWLVRIEEPFTDS